MPFARIEEAVAAVEGINSADVEIVWDEAWTVDRLSPDATRKLRFLPAPNAVADRDAYIAAHRAQTEEASR